MITHKLVLYITGHTARSELAIRNLEKICADHTEYNYKIEIIDILEHPQLAENHRIMATPTLIKELPLPIRRIIGDLSDTEKVLLGLDIQSDKPMKENNNVSGK